MIKFRFGRNGPAQEMSWLEVARTTIAHKTRQGFFEANAEAAAVEAAESAIASGKGVNAACDAMADALDADFYPFNTGRGLVMTLASEGIIAI